MRSGVASWCLGLSLLASPLEAAAQPDPCARVDCSRRGTCFAEHGAAHCLCDRGHAALGHACVAVDEEDVLRARRDPSLGERVADLAMSQLERNRGQVGRRLPGLPVEPLSEYLDTDEWWCSDFVSWVYAASGAPFTGGAAGGWLVTNNFALRTWYVRHELWVSRRALGSYVPQAGDFVRVETGRGGHAAIVHHVEGSTLFAVEGNVSGRVELARYHEYRSHRMIDGFGRLAPDDAPPSVEAGEDLELVVPGDIELDLVVTDDGPAARLETEWSILRGPAGARVEGASTARARFFASRPGTYHLAVVARDGRHEARDTRAIRAIENEPPTVRARLLSLSAFDAKAEVEGVAEDDGVPRALTQRWSCEEGVGEARFEDAAAVRTAVTFSAPGRYVLRRTASDGAEEAHAELTVEVPPWPGGCAATPTPARGAYFAGAMLFAWCAVGAARRRRGQRT